MRRCGALLCLALAGAGSCGRVGYDSHAQAADAGRPDGIFAADAVPPPCDPLTFWEIDFSSDPTTVDVNRDGTSDWVTRSGQPFPTAQLSGGVWNAKPNVHLDTRPLDPFN